MTLPKGVVAFEAESVSFSLNVNGGGAQTVAIPDGTYYVLGDDTSDDLLKVIEDEVNTDASYADFEATLNTTSGIVSLAVGSGDTAVLTWTSSGTDLRDWLRFTGSTENLTSTAADGDRTHKGGFYPDRVAAEDRPIFNVLRRATEADDGTVEVIHYARRRRQRLKLTYEGGTRASSYKEIDQFESWWSLMAEGKPMRWYPDKTVTAAYAKVTEPYGYQTWKLLSPIELEHVPLQDGWYGWFQAEMLLALQS